MATQDHRFLVSPDGTSADWIHPLELDSRPGWHDCTDMDDEEFQRFVAERQAARPHIVGVAVTKQQASMTLAAFDRLEHEQRRTQAEQKAEIERKARNTL